MINNYLELVDIEEIEFTEEYNNMVDITVDIDESFCLSSGIISHNSAAGTVLTGFASTGRDYFGCFPLKGKPLNVRKETIAKIKENDEIKHIITALGLEFGKKYTSTRELRYGKLVIMSDSDNDGSHIKGLIINFFHLFWPELLNLDFIYEFVTPIVKIEKGSEKNKQAKFFYKLDDYRKWKELNEKGWFVTYYKGLGTIEPDEAIAFFKNITKHLIRFHQTEMEETTNAVELAFNEKRADDRKEWLLNYKGGVEVDKFVKKTTYMSFFNEEFIQFSMADNIRSIPSIMDGLKPSQRKILYTLFKNNYKEKIKVSNLSGAVTEKSSYHHGACLDYDTEILLADGSYIKIGDWCERYPEVELLVKCIDEHENVVVGIGKNPISLKKEIEYFEIELEDGTIIKCTDNHMFYVDGKYIEAKDLTEDMNILDIKEIEKRH